ncbi:flavin-containing monooxygenase FMO GS-OX-like 4 [Phtheirospermum japonicum]|uniref:Flavin-containing monooxygenase n=1 Tax=Phtheirospermum japonicum TaxID=374723 RepID=A0A830BAG8_9LAMI|nr:flavin-containing monooxygenase FMO GS-OX-like 4 [Phtheirospermum japonicum]
MTIPKPNPTVTVPLPLTAMPSSVSRTIAVIGAGAAGLSAALELRREGHRVVVYEREAQIGGTWAYTPETESDPMGIDPTREVIHSSLYASLRTNLPREVMGFRVYPFLVSGKPGRDPRRFPGHTEVLEYLRDFAEEFRLSELVRFGREVLHVGLVEDRKWVVRSKKRNSEDGDNEVYDAVVVCNGHYSEPRIAEIPGVDEWPGKQIHSHNYRVPDPFHNQVVVLIGSSASADDISRDIAKVAKEVHIASRSVQNGAIAKLPGHDKIWLHSMVKLIYVVISLCHQGLSNIILIQEYVQIDRVHKDGAVTFKDGNVIYADVILHCTGYKYHFPFLETNGIVTVEDNRVGPLYKHVFPPTLAPWLSFVGLPWKSKWIAGVLSGRIPLESTKEMMADVETFYSSLEASGIPKRYTHHMGESQFEYDDWLADKSGSLPTEEWRKEMYFVTGRRKRSTPETYRDHWEDEDLISLAHQDFKSHFLEVSV